VKPTEIRYAKNGDVRIAYQVVGNGPLDLVYIPGFVSNLEIQGEDAGYSHLLRRLATFSRLILLDKRGTGLSDRIEPNETAPLRARMEDVRAVMDAAGSGRAALIGAADGAAIATLFAATYPERTRGIVLYGGYAHFPTYVMGHNALTDFVRSLETSWGSGATLSHFAPGRLCDLRFHAWWARLERLSATPTAASVLARQNATIDVRPLLGDIRTPTLVLHRTDDVCVRFAGGRHLAERIAGARLVEMPGRDHPIWTGDVDRIVDEMEEFLTGNRPLSGQDRLLATILVARIPAPERLATRAGTNGRNERLDNLHKAVREIVARHSGHLLGTGTESISARFDRPALAVRCALALRDAVATLGFDLATGIHTGEIELGEGLIAGLAVQATEQMSTRAKAGEVLVSGVVADLVAGSGLQFARRGIEPIEGIDAPLRLLAVLEEQGRAPATRLLGAPALGALSTREREVLVLIAEGRSNAAIAKRLRLSEHTVKRHVANILLKLELPTRAAAAALAGCPPA
jgi:pimeloyl-ACP methyl ester carboxylesterase/DNA-binding CsgD family transcriptional regulator